MSALFAPVFNRGHAPKAFITELAAWGKDAPEPVFDPNPHYDIYSRVKPELGPYDDILHRRAVMLEVLRVLAGFESSWNWHEGSDASRRTEDTSENTEAGAWQVSYDSRKLDPDLRVFIVGNGILSGHQFQRVMKETHTVAMEYAARLLRIDTKDFSRVSNGPVRKGPERKATWHDRPHLWQPQESIYPWLSRDAVAEWKQLLTA